MDKKELLSYLLCNTRKYIKEHPNRSTSRYEVFLLEAVIHEQTPETYDERIFPDIIETLKKDGFDVSNFLLYNSNEEGTFTFMSMDERQMFDIVHDYGNSTIIVYVDEYDNQQECSNIAEAVSKYHYPW